MLRLTGSNNHARLKRARIDTNMAYSQTHQPSDIEKRIGSIRTQLYGKKVNLASNKAIQSLSEQSYLVKDLTKTMLLATAVIAIQLVIFLIKP